MKTLGERLTFLREQKKLNRAQVMKDLSIHNLGRYEENERSPNLETVVSLAKYYRVSTDWLLTGEEKLFPSNGNDVNKNTHKEFDSLENVMHYLQTAISERQVTRNDLFQLINDIYECIAAAYDPEAVHSENLNKYELSLIKNYRKLPDRDQGAVDQFVRTLLAALSADSKQDEKQVSQEEKQNSMESSASQTGRGEIAAAKMDAEGRIIA
ncbi:MAG TPA: helix-turn-helix transcriptional regulator [Clostridiaceae bacterium]|jgi:transcriptional regulator with XRE-family HTH domain|nr:helix-turn-helix transcriptional regulator [Clostridiaceae bacterium]